MKKQHFNIESQILKIFENARKEGEKLLLDLDHNQKL